MNTGIALITTLMMACIIAPIVLIKLNSAKEKKQLITAVKLLAKKNNNQLTAYEAFNDFAIGVDSSSKQLYFYKNTSGERVTQHINLEHLQHCTIIKHDKTIRNKKETTVFIEKLELAFSKKNGEPVKNIVLFNAEANYQLSGELDLADRWKKKLNDMLISSKTDSFITTNAILVA